MRALFIASLTMAALTGCSQSVADCQVKYAASAGSPLASRLAANACSALENPESPPEKVQWAECVLDTIPQVQNDMGARVASSACEVKCDEGMQKDAAGACVLPPTPQALLDFDPFKPAPTEPSMEYQNAAQKPALRRLTPAEEAAIVWDQPRREARRSIDGASEGAVAAENESFARMAAEACRNNPGTSACGAAK